MIATATTSKQQTLYGDRESLQEWRVTMNTSNTRPRKFGSIIGRIVMALVFASMIGGTFISPAFGRARTGRAGYTLDLSMRHHWTSMSRLRHRESASSSPSSFDRECSASTAECSGPRYASLWRTMRLGGFAASQHGGLRMEASGATGTNWGLHRGQPCAGELQKTAECFCHRQAHWPGWFWGWRRGLA